MKVTSTPNAPAAIGPYSQAIEVNGFLFASGSDLHQKPGFSTAAVFCLDATVCSSPNISRTCLMVPLAHQY